MDIVFCFLFLFILGYTIGCLVMHFAAKGY
jgi:hypothetical protein